jgi:hypothetical protein
VRGGGRFRRKKQTKRAAYLHASEIGFVVLKLNLALCSDGV